MFFKSLDAREPTLIRKDVFICTPLKAKIFPVDEKLKLLPCFKKGCRR